MDESGFVVAEYRYDAFGATIAASGPLANAFRFRFSTKYHDPETDLYYYGYRFYSPELHRWVNRDPIEEEGGFNLYAFCGNDGVNAIDPRGLDPAFGVMAGVSFAPSTRGGTEIAFSLMGSARWEACDRITLSADIGIRVLGGGAIGTSLSTPGLSSEIFANISGTVGGGESGGLPFAFNGSQWVSALNDTYANSMSVGQTWYYSQSLGERVRMANLRLQGGGSVFANYNNDIRNPARLGFGDGGDRGWTGGGMVGFAVGGDQTLAFAFDDFSGSTPDPTEYDRRNPNKQNRDSWSRSPTGAFD